MPMIRRAFLAAIVLLTGFFVRTPAIAQTGTAAVAGSVVDQTGSIVAGARVTLTPTGVSGVTNPQGYFRLPAVAAGKYTLTISYVGFEPQMKDIEVTAGNRSSMPAGRPGRLLQLDVGPNSCRVSSCCEAHPGGARPELGHASTAAQPWP